MDYLINFFDDRDHLRRAERIQCEDDHLAISRAAAVDHPHALELWQGDRFVWRLEAKAIPRLSGRS